MEPISEIVIIANTQKPEERGKVLIFDIAKGYAHSMFHYLMTRPNSVGGVVPTLEFVSRYGPYHIKSTLSMNAYNAITTLTIHQLYKFVSFIRRQGVLFR